MQPPRRPPRRLAALALLALAAACTDARNPAAPDPGENPRGPKGDPVLLQALRCEGDVKARTLTCQTPPPTNALPSYLLLGNQNVYVKVTATAIDYDSGTGAFTFDATVRNLIPQALGTTDGTTLDGNGVRVFFVEGTTLTTVTGSGAVTVAGDGVDLFTASNQPYYQYNEVLSQYELSPAREWTLNVPSTVNTFAFTVLISAAVQFPNGWIEVQPGTHSMPALANRQLSAVVRNVVGDVDSTVVVNWSTGDAGTATVAGIGYAPGTGSYLAGSVGVRAGPVTITATDGVRSGSMTMNVTGIIRAWTGAASSDWSNGANWSPVNVLPAAADSVTIPFGVPNYPALVANTTIGGVDVADGATLSLGAFDLTVNANLATGFTLGSGILATTGTLVLAGTAGPDETVHGRGPSIRVTGNYALSNNLFLVAPETVESGNLTNTNFEMQVVAQ